MSDAPHVAFIGLGVMGSRMATTLARGGYALDVFDVDPAKTRAVAEVGPPRPAASTISMLP
jgi:3-hydroxyisobutyrate dehydrogenase-like beta-hydroxyacid dehydrogenase